LFVGAPLLGAILAFVAQYVYLIFGFPLIVGVAAGAVMAQGIRWGKVRDVAVAASLGLLLGFCTYGSYRFIDYLLARNELQTLIVEEYADSEDGPVDSAAAAAILDYILLEETGQTGFLGYVLLEAREGLSVSHRGIGPSLNVGTAITWVYWVIELVIYTAMPAFAAYNAANKPFCRYHNRWYEREKSLGGTIRERVADVESLLDAGDFAGLSRNLRPQAPIPGIELFIERCTDCQESDPIMTIKSVYRSSRGRKHHEVLERRTLSAGRGNQLPVT
jgi:hypothetical protein